MRLVDERLLTERPRNPELALYRNRTVGMLKKYLRMSCELGHLPGLGRRETFRSHVTCYGSHTFEDTAIFVLDLERCLELLSNCNQQLIGVLYFQEYTVREAARLAGCGVATLCRCRDEALDALTEIFLARDLLRRLPQFQFDELDLAIQDAVIEDEHPELPPRKRVGSVKVVHAVAFSA